MKDQLVLDPEHSFEDRACALVMAIRSAELGRQVDHQPWDVPPRQGAHDYWLDNKTEALEVTTLAAQMTIENHKHWDKRGPHSGDSVDGLTACWMVMIDPGHNARPAEQNLARWLLSLEADGITRAGRWGSPDHRAHPTVAEMVTGGVIDASVVPGGPAGTFMLSYVSDIPGRPAGDPNHLVAAINDALTLESHRKREEKLGRSGAPHRHLFFWVEPWSRFDVVRAADEGLPTIAPQLDVNVTRLWIGLPVTSQTTDLLRWSSATGWQRDTQATPSHDVVHGDR